MNKTNYFRLKNFICWIEYVTWEKHYIQIVISRKKIISKWTKMHFKAKKLILSCGINEIKKKKSCQWYYITFWKLVIQIIVFCLFDIIFLKTDVTANFFTNRYVFSKYRNTSEIIIHISDKKKVKFCRTI